MGQEIYVEVRHMDFWWGIYSFEKTTSWEDFVFYEQRDGDFMRLGIVCVCARRFLESGLSDLENDPAEKAFAEKVKAFLQSSAIAYQYSYDEPDDEDFYEVPFEAPHNEKGVKPSYIEMWYPADGIDMEVLKECTTAFCAKFLNRQVNDIRLKDIPSFEQIVVDYEEETKQFSDGPVQITFTDEVIKQMQEKLGLSEKEARDLIQRSIQ